MKLSTCIFLLLFLFLHYIVNAQNTDLLADSLNHNRININKEGLTILAGEGIASLGTGAIGYFVTQDQELKSFFEMTAFWGVVNTGIAAAGIVGAKNELAQALSCRQAFKKYKQTTKLYLINSGLDIVYIGAGAFLINRANQTQNNQQTLNGFGKAIALQGILLLIFDQVMYHAHYSSNSQWRRVLNSVCITNNGVGFRYTF